MSFPYSGQSASSIPLKPRSALHMLVPTESLVWFFLIFPAIQSLKVLFQKSSNGGSLSLLHHLIREDSWCLLELIWSESLP